MSSYFNTASENAITGILTIVIMSTLVHFIIFCGKGIRNVYRRVYYPEEFVSGHVNIRHNEHRPEPEPKLVSVKDTIKCKLLKDTKLRPKERLNDPYYVTLLQDYLDAEVKHHSTVTVDGVAYKVTLPNREHNGCCISNPITPFTIVIPEGFKYGISDQVKDPIGLPKVLEVDTEFNVSPDTRVILEEGTLLLTAHGTKLRLTSDTVVTI
jgi:hypothetical protein